MKDTKKSPQFYARVYGLLYIIHFLSVFNMGYVLQKLVIPGNAQQTVANITESESLFRLGFIGDLISQTVFIFLVLILYKLLKSVNKNHALVMLVLALTSVPIAMLSLLNQFAVLQLLSGADYLTVLNAEQIGAQVMLLLDLHQYGVSIAMIFWALWLFPLGVLVFKSRFLPKFIGVMLIIACFGYLIDFFNAFLLPDFTVSIGQFTFIGEIIFWLWLLIKGVNMKKWNECNYSL